MGKYLKLFNNHSQYETFTGSTEFVLPNVSHCITEEHVHYNPTSGYTPITEYTALQIVSSAATFHINGENMKYSKNGGVSWTPFTSEDTISATSGENVALSVNNVSGFSSTGSFDLEGNIMSLVYGDGFRDNPDVPSGFTFAHLFDGQGVVNAENLILPANQHQTYHLYDSMFENCEELLTPPQMPATELAPYCYESMFYNCTSLLRAPELPATALTEGCYWDMFNQCHSLSGVPQNMLPATTLATKCYSNMFRECYAMTTAPDLPAPILVDECYNSMFQECNNLSHIKCLATSFNGQDCTSRWVTGVAENGTFVKAASMNDWPTSLNGIPDGWTVQDA